ncbi:WXG100-like domain-containing protein, partial [Catellatospora coxensis]
MGMQVPDWVGKFFLIVTGESWPQADEDQLWALARLWAALEQVLIAVEEELVAIGHAVDGAGWKGEAAQAVRARLEQLIDSGDLHELVE